MRLFFEGVGLFVLIFTSLWGIFSLARLLVKQLWEDTAEKRIFSVLPLFRGEEDAEYLLRILEKRTGGEALAVDFGMDKGTREIVLRRQAERRDFLLLTEEELPRYLLESCGKIGARRT